MLAQLNYRSFRNLKDTRWETGPGCHLIVGPNGAGKTSLLEAIYLLATTRSFRTSRIPDCRRFGSLEFYVGGEVRADSRTRLEVGLGSAGRYRAVNGRATGLVDHLRVLPVVAWTTADGEMMSGSPESRRRFVDQGIVGLRPAALEVLARYRRALSQKRQLLTQQGRALASWNEVMARAAVELMSQRRDYVERLSATVRQIVHQCGLDVQEVSLEYRPSIRADHDGVDAVLAALEKVKHREQQAARPLLGPHLDEVSIRWGPHLVRRIASAGERKTLGLLLSAARGRLLAAAGRPPVFLLDDADSDLDDEHLAAIWRVFRGESQVFMSSSRRASWAVAPEAIRWDLKAGQLKPARDPGNRV